MMDEDKVYGEDPLGIGRGIIYGVVFGAVLWAIIIGGVWLALR